MSKNIGQVPLTEIVERVIEIGRIREEIRGKVRGVVNDIYVRDIPRCDDWSFFMTRTSLTKVAQYNAGNVTATTGSTSVNFSGAVITTGMTGMKLKITNTDYLYDFTYASSSDGTVNPPIVGNQNVSGGSYVIYQNLYSLPSDFDRFPKNGGLHYYQGGKVKNVPEKNYDYYLDQFQSTPNDTTEFCRVSDYQAVEQRKLEVIPPPITQGSWEMDYLKRVTPLGESSAGTVNINAGGTTVTGNATLFTDMNTGDYIRIDAFGISGDSTWYRIDTIISSSNMTISTVFGSSSCTIANYVISSAPKIPESMHLAIMYGALTQIEADQNDPMTQGYKQKYADILSDNKKIYRTRLTRSDVPTIAEEYHYRR